MTLFGAVELGGTKIRVGRGRGDGTILDSDTFPTTGPDQSFARLLEYFRAGPPVAGIGIGSFGPVAVGAARPDRGTMLSTPKAGWSGFNVAEALQPLGLPVRIETDVAAAGLGEARKGALRGVECGIYLTVGTGIGGALLIGSRIVNGAAHAEMGHTHLRRAREDHSPSTCPYHDSCAEGLVCGPAIQRRFGRSLSATSSNGPERALIADYLGQLIAALTLILCPHRMVIGGGVAKTPGLLGSVKTSMLRHLNGYASYPEQAHADFLVSPALRDDAGLAGALILAAEAGTAPA
jgi:fructokinase